MRGRIDGSCKQSTCSMVRRMPGCWYTACRTDTDSDEPEYLEATQRVSDGDPTDAEAVGKITLRWETIPWFEP